jgi:hypothetical protein
MDEIETANSVVDAESDEGEDAEVLVAEKSHTSDAFGDGSVR